MNSVQAAAGQFSLLSLFLETDFVIKADILAMIFMSVWSWMIIFEKVFLLHTVKDAAKRFQAQFWSGASLDEMYDKLEAKPFRLDPMSAIFVAAMREWRRSSKNLGAGIHGTSLQQRIERVMQICLDREMDRIEKRMTFLASTGSVAPFLGLFGTVWGIINSFSAISASSAASLNVMARGISEALFTTALGLMAAIPAVLAYNKFSSDINRYAQGLENFSGEFGTILSRLIDDKANRAEKRSAS